MVNPILKRVILAASIGVLTVLFDLIIHASATSPQEIVNYFAIGFLGSFLISFILFPLYEKNKLFIILGALLFAGWKGAIYLVTKEPYGFIPIRYSSVDSLFEIAVFGSTNPILQIIFWTIAHGGSYALAFLIVYYINEFYFED